jgi:hypothetical protein
MNAAFVPALIALALPLAGQDTPPPAWTQADLEKVSAEIQEQVQTLRGARFARPVKVQLTDAKGFRDYALAREQKTTTPARLSRDETIAKLLGLVAPDLDLRAAEMEILETQVGGFYDPGSDTFYLMDTMRGSVAKVILAHELTHALDDQLHDIDATLQKAREETDAELAFRSVVEGSGSNAMNLWTVQHGGEVSLSELQKFQDLGADSLRKAPPFLWKPLLASYLAGDAFLVRAKGLNLTLAPAQAADVDRAFREPPRSTEQVLHPEKYWDTERRDDPVAVQAGAAPAAWRALGEDTLGELVLALLATPPAERKGIDPTNPMAVLQARFTNGPAEGWGGDRAVLLGRGDDRFLQLVTVWDTPQDAAEFAAALGGCAPRTWSASERDAAHGWRAGFAPTGWSVAQGKNADGRAWVVVRSWSVADPKDASADALQLAWKVADAPAASTPGGG